MNFPFSLRNNLIVTTVTAPNRQDLLDVQGTGLIQGSRYVNPTTQDFQLQANGLFVGENAVTQQVWLSLNTTFGTSAQNGFGQTFSQVKVITPAIQALMINALNQTLASMINEGTLTLGNVQVFQLEQNMINISFSYFNNTQGTTATVNFTLNNGILI